LRENIDIRAIIRLRRDYTQATSGTPERRNGTVPSVRAIAQKLQAALLPSNSVESDGNH
jgi:hypothetical protein